MADSQDPKQVNNNDLRNAQFGGGFINAENVNAGRIGGDIWNIFFGQQTTPVGNPARPKNERLLLAAVKEEVTARLKQSLHNAVLINLGKESQPQQVKRPWDADIKIGLKPAEPLLDTTTILEIFDQEEIAGKLLILGNPGAGKTTTTLDLAKALITRAEKKADYPIPVLFNLSNWKNDRQLIHDWLVAELKSKYGVRKDISSKWLDNAKLLPMLDGLDELEPVRQEPCVRKINEFLQSDYRPKYLLVCSRWEEYANYHERLQLNGAICLRLLSYHQIKSYLANLNRTQLWQFLQTDTTLLELVRKPLMLSIIILSYEELATERWINLTSNISPLEYLLNAYIRQMMSRSLVNQMYSKQEASVTKWMQRWLAFLAQYLQSSSKTEFSIDDIQAGCFQTIAQKRIYYFTIKIALWLFSGFIVGLIFGKNFGLVSGFVISLIINLSETIQLADKIKFSFNRLIVGCKLGSFIGAIGGFLYSFLFALYIAIAIDGIKNINILTFLVFWAVLTIFLTIIFSVSSGLIFGIFLSLIKEEFEIKFIPNQGIINSFKNAIIYSMFSGLILGITWSLIYIVFPGNNLIKIDEPDVYVMGTTEALINVAIISGLKFAVSSGLAIWLLCGGFTCLQHFVLRLILHFNGYIPWNYARFLDYCTERMLLQRVGGRYRFIHKLLQDHFAQMEFKRD
ncbi:NACHT domain-containing protein [Nostocaceae cyanobacterium CENA369]|uniref:NACHT domain-containing protein n=1 Tax=Dendronalium phyllosphericum CENA369 TaxID=1725256 RepID=A0A8J7I3W8_9NOST|nr:NACHT domain-containing protein [Dendronalium phyllosphericum]MBH8573035.1 NACHT domain-containing protein [Dendronalium phyllosphericum CENA369]